MEKKKPTIQENLRAADRALIDLKQKYLRSEKSLNKKLIGIEETYLRGFQKNWPKAIDTKQVDEHLAQIQKELDGRRERMQDMRRETQRLLAQRL